MDSKMGALFNMVVVVVLFVAVVTVLGNVLFPNVMQTIQNLVTSRLNDAMSVGN